MNAKHDIVVFGAGGIGEAVSLILVEHSHVVPNIYIGDLDYEKAVKVAENIENWTEKDCEVHPFHVSPNEVNDGMKTVLSKGDIILDCLPGTEAPRLARFALEYDMHYTNLTEYVNETNEIIAMAEGAKTGFILQTGLAPGFINIVANDLYQQFCRDYATEKVEHVAMKVGALPQYAPSPYNYGFTWSTIGVATEYMKDTIAIRDYKKVKLKALSERASIFIKGVKYEEDLTSGGAADLPDALAGKTSSLDYKTLRHPGHYDWVLDQIASLGDQEDKITGLRAIMEKNIPSVIDDNVIIYASVKGLDHRGIYRQLERSYDIGPTKVGKKLLRAIQVTTAAPMAESAKLLLEGGYSGIITQSKIPIEPFLNGIYVQPIYSGKPALSAVC